MGMPHGVRRQLTHHQPHIVDQVQQAVLDEVDTDEAPGSQHAHGFPGIAASYHQEAWLTHGVPALRPYPRTPGGWVWTAPGVSNSARTHLDGSANRDSKRMYLLGDRRQGFGWRVAVSTARFASMGSS